jgi:hypothetical protein
MRTASGAIGKLVRLARRGERSGVWAAAALAFALHARHLWNLGALGNRVYGHWQRADALALAANLALTTALLWVAIAGIARLLRGRLPPAGFTLARAAARAGSLALPVVFVTLVQLFARPEWGSDPDPLAPPPAAREAAGATPIYWIVFDEWSFEQSAQAGRFPPLLHHLGRLAERSFFFEDALSPSHHTKVVLSKLLFPEHGRSLLELAEDSLYWRSGGERVRTPDARSVFAGPAERGYRSALVGFYLPYRLLLGSQVDVVRTEPHAPQGHGLVERMQVQALASFRWLPERWWRERESRHWWELNHRVRRDVLEVIERWPAATFLFAHWPLPHPPFVMGSDGSYHGPYRVDRREGDAADYRRHLLYLDRVVGEIVSALEASGRFDDALLVMTGDHGWQRHDQAVRHVPLLVKWPGQRAGERVAGRFSTLELGGLVELAARGGASVSEARAFIAERAR